MGEQEGSNDITRGGQEGRRESKRVDGKARGKKGEQEGRWESKK